MVNAPLPSDDQRQASSAPGAARVDDDLVRDHEGRVEADAELADQRRRPPCSRLRRPACRGRPWCRSGRWCRARSVRSSRVMPTPLSETVSVLASGIDRDLDRERRAVLDQFGPGDRLVAQLLAGVGGVGDELADENLAVGIDRMDHEMQQARNVGLEALRGRGFAGRGLGVGGQGRTSSEECGKVEGPA